MNFKLRLYQIILTLIMIQICGLITIMYGWQGYSTLTERAGYRGFVHYYYRLTIGEFSIYNLSVALLACGLFLFQIIFLLDKNWKLLKRSWWLFGIYIVLIVLAELYLETRFIPKG